MARPKDPALASPPTRADLHRRWTVAQIGSREHYGVAWGLYRAGLLRRIYTEVWCRYGAKYFGHLPGPFGLVAGRFHPDLPSDRVTSFTLDALIRTGRQRLSRRPPGIEGSFLGFLSVGEWFGRRVTRHLERQQLDPGRDIFFGYGTGCLEVQKYLCERSVPTVVDQIDPAREQERVALLESQRWPGWQKLGGRIPEAYWNRLAAEWQAASIVLVNSTWTKLALIRQGVPDAKIVVVPLAYEAPDLPPRPLRPTSGAPLTVLWVGSVNLAKGIPYLIDAARRLQGENLRFVVAGSIGITREALSSVPPNMKFLGHVDRARAQVLYRHADVFVIPTLSDGFAITQLEAMAHGVPVITTPNCGEVVSSGVDGFVVPPADSQALAKAIAALERDRLLLQNMSRRALAKSKQFSLDSYVERLTLNVSRCLGEVR